MAQKQDFFDRGVFTVKNGRVKLGRGGYMTTADAVSLAAACVPLAGGSGSALDVGIGPGGAALCLLDDLPDIKITGIDSSADMIARARENAALNGRELALVHADITQWRTGSLFDLVLTNPPYFSGTARKDGAHHGADLYEWTRACVRRLRARGNFACIVDAGVLDKVIAALHDGKCGAVALAPAGPRVIISARLGVKTMSKIVFDSPCRNVA